MLYKGLNGGKKTSTTVVGGPGKQQGQSVVGFAPCSLNASSMENLNIMQIDQTSASFLISPCTGTAI